MGSPHLKVQSSHSLNLRRLLPLRSPRRPKLLLALRIIVWIGAIRWPAVTREALSFLVQGLQRPLVQRDFWTPQELSPSIRTTKNCLLDGARVVVRVRLLPLVRGGLSISNPHSFNKLGHLTSTQPPQSQKHVDISYSSYRRRSSCTKSKVVIGPK
jgi:hypothetical protein